MLAILIDIHEPEAIADELRKTLTVVRSNNEPIGYADYLWNTGHYKIMVERKQGGELLSSIGGRLDTQLLKYQEAHPDAQIVILQEGHITPTPDNRCRIWKQTQQKNRKNPIWVVHRESPFAYTAYRSYIFARMLEGIPTIVTASEHDTALTLASMLYNSMKSKHDGLNKYAVRKRKRQKNESAEYNQYIRILTTIPGIGEKTAHKVLGIWDTPWDFFSTDLPDIEEIMGERVMGLVRDGIGKDE